MNRYRIYKKAEKLIEAGWARNTMTYHSPNGEVAYCLYGALREANGISVFLPATIEYEVAKILPYKSNKLADQKITWWNDNKATKKDVIKVLRKLKRRHILGALRP